MKRARRSRCGEPDSPAENGLPKKRRRHVCCECLSGHGCKFDDVCFALGLHFFTDSSALLSGGTEWINRKESFAADLKLSHCIGSSGELRGAESGETLNTSFRTQMVALRGWNPSRPTS